MPTYDEKHEERPNVAREVGSTMDELEDQLGEMARQASAFIAQEARENPYRTVLVAAGVGYVLGGGIPSWALRLGFNAATRMAVAAAIAQVTASATED